MPLSNTPAFLVAGFVLLTHPICVLSADDAVNFERDVRPIFQDHCVDCHGVDEQNGGLRLDSRVNVFAEADSGSHAVVPGDVDSSELLVRVLSSSDADQMPPDGDRLTAANIEVLRRWIVAGAIWPEGIDTVEDEIKSTDHWSFQPVRDPPVPQVADSRQESVSQVADSRQESLSQVADSRQESVSVEGRTGRVRPTSVISHRNPIDAFIDAKRQSLGLSPVPPASPLTFIRRVTYDLTGLPPTREELARFQQCVDQEGADAATSQLVDDLLSRDTYGERWGRHWMDWVRYADTAGDNSDFPIPEAYLYRNYIIDSLNQDVPYDRFITEQIAGDLLPADSLEQRNRQTIATGYLAMARRFGSLVETYPWHLTIEDTIDNVGRTMMGLTISCARCHDHKFDPITARDYYGLYGIFESTRYPFPGIELFQTQRDFVPLLAEADVQAKLGPHRDKTQELVDELNRRLERCEVQARENAELEKTVGIDEQRRLHDKLEVMLKKARNAGNALADHLRELPSVPSAYAVQDASPMDARLQIKGEPNRPGAMVPRGFPQVLGGQRLSEDVADSTSGRRQLASWITDPDNPLTPRVIVNRIWQRHFGTGIVPSSSDFGLRGEKPSHPDLLDWLTRDFIRHDWSLKHLHRRILTSQTYRLSSEDLESNVAKDPSNRWLWKFNRQRLDAESIRDTLLMLGGGLDPSPATKPHPFPPKKEWKFTQHHPFNDEYASQKRSVYRMTKRLTAKTYFQTFDGPDPNVCTSDRDQSITAIQALYFVNDEFLHQQAAAFASNLPCGGDDREKLRFALETILGRPPTDSEADLLLQHVENIRDQFDEDPEADQLAWTSLTRSLFRLNEFLYLD